ncbi:hypothetical protein E2C01_058596 [Portunus trituberculatus]|uniref:Uncharacterized protein n=1 Tax=Portunus trituberculatus TaxID=210409 RepID=A0A5B7H3E7_PORTR|nr:hypothetical protein [Portunus trituberculatus]
MEKEEEEEESRNKGLMKGLSIDYNAFMVFSGAGNTATSLTPAQPRPAQPSPAPAQSSVAMTSPNYPNLIILCHLYFTFL